MEENERTMTPAQYFELVKDMRRQQSDATLDAIYKGCLDQLNKQKITGQVRAAERTFFMMECIAKERELVKLGFTSFVYRDDVDHFIDSVADKVVKLIELENYARDIPDEIVQAIDRTRKIFDMYYVLFTDYTGEEERRVQQERRSKDPILFGVFSKSAVDRFGSQRNSLLLDRFYVVGDWVDEYCDLTFDKMVAAMAEKGSNIEHTLKTPEDIEEFKAMVASVIESKNGMRTQPLEKKKVGLFGKVRTFLHG